MFQSQNTFHFNVPVVHFFSLLKAALTQQCYKLQQLKTGFRSLIWKQSMEHMCEQKLIVIFLARICSLIPSVHGQNGFLLFFLFWWEKNDEGTWSRKSPADFTSAVSCPCSYTGGLKVCVVQRSLADVLSIQGQQSGGPNVLWPRSQIYPEFLPICQSPRLDPHYSMKTCQTPQSEDTCSSDGLSQHWVSALLCTQPTWPVKVIWASFYLFSSRIVNHL